MIQEDYYMACLEKFGLAGCNRVGKQISFRLTAQDQPETLAERTDSRALQWHGW